MSKAALILVGLAAATGIALAVNHADAKPVKPKPPSQDDPDADDGEVQETPDSPPEPQEPSTTDGPHAPGPVPGSGTGEPKHSEGAHLDWLPPELQNVNLSGEEFYSYNGMKPVGDEAFNTWIVANSLNGMMMQIFRSVTSPDDWISMFVHPDPPGSDPPAHFIVYKVSDSKNKNWMIENIAHMAP